MAAWCRAKRSGSRGGRIWAGLCSHAQETLQNKGCLNRVIAKDFLGLYLSMGSQEGFLTSEGHLATSGNIFHCDNLWRGASIGI